MTQIPTLTLRDGRTMPQLGFGVWQVPPDEVVAPVATALAAGYRLLDTAAAYRNEKGVGRAIAESGVPREDLFVTTKLWNPDHGYDKTHSAFEDSLGRLGLDWLDLYLIHWPVPSAGLYVEAWKAMIDLVESGRVRSIGVSNFNPAHVQRLIDETGVVPVVNQVELHPGFAQPEVRAFDAAHDIVTEAWSPLGQGRGLLADPVLGAVAEAHGRTPAQVALRWNLQLGNVVIPKSVTPDRIRANLEIFDFELDEGEVERLAALPGRRLGPDPDTFVMP
jgi:2,5-diketo-D-gluconate reductase A